VKIVTQHVYPPIPDRSNDWCAYDEDTYDGADDSHPVVGWGATEAEARADFLQIWQDREEQRELDRAGKAVKVWDDVFNRLLGERS